jgi:hypothetical protein
MITLDRLKILLDAYGADPGRWPDGQREAARELLTRSPEARAYVQQASVLDTLLDTAPLTAPPGLDAAALAARIMRMPGRVAATAAAWRFSFGWPNFATLAAAAVFGLVIGWTDIQMSQGYAADGDVLELLSPVSVAENPLW